MHRGEIVLLGQALRRRQQRRGSVGLAQQQPWACGRRERHRALQLGIIAAPGTLPGIGPALVEHIFALAVGLEIARQYAHRHTLGIVHHQMRRLPAGASTGAARSFQSSEELMRCKRVFRPGAGIPLSG